MELVGSGKKYTAAAFDLGIAPGTVKTHLVRAYRKLGVESAREAMLALYPFRMTTPKRRRPAISEYQQTLLGDAA